MEVLNMEEELWQELDDRQAEIISGGRNDWVTLQRLQEEFAATGVSSTSQAKQPEAEGKIRGPLILNL
jgi:hypothetical protein